MLPALSEADLDSLPDELTEAQRDVFDRAARGELDEPGPRPRGSPPLTDTATVTWADLTAEERSR